MPRRLFQLHALVSVVRHTEIRAFKVRKTEPDGLDRLAPGIEHRKKMPPLQIEI
jgi:hypothetical protein